MKKITESDSYYNNIEQLSSIEQLRAMNTEDKKVAIAVEQILPDIAIFIEKALPLMQKGGRLFYIGAGTSGRLGIVDASECPPTFGVPDGVVVGLIAGGDVAIRKAVEFAEDNTKLGWEDLQKYKINTKDTLVGIAASGSTPYVLGALEMANKEGILTAGITCNPESPLSKIAQYPLVPKVGPEFITGSTRLKSGTAQKMVLNMISTALMIGLGHVKGNRMVDMQLSNDKLIKRGSLMVANACNISEEDAKKILLKWGSVRKAIAAFRKN